MGLVSRSLGRRLKAKLIFVLLLLTLGNSNGGPNASTVKWYAHQVSLEELNCHVLILLDCCTAGGNNSTGRSDGTRKNGAKELIAACGFEPWTPNVNKHSFTKHLTKTLEQLLLALPLTVSYLHQQILGSLKRCIPLLDANETTRVRTNPYERGKRRTPIYAGLNIMPRRTIQIAPLPAPTDRASSGISPCPPDKAVKIRQTLDSLTRSQEMDTRTEVLICVHFDWSERLSITELRDWILHMPLVAKIVTLRSESFVLGCSGDSNYCLSSASGRP